MRFRSRGTGAGSCTKPSSRVGCRGGAVHGWPRAVIFGVASGALNLSPSVCVSLLCYASRACWSCPLTVLLVSAAVWVVFCACRPVANEGPGLSSWGVGGGFAPASLLCVFLGVVSFTVLPGLCLPLLSWRGCVKRLGERLPVSMLILKGVKGHLTSHITG
jgi:hypothetical protein